MRLITDPIECIIADSLTAANLDFNHESQGNTSALDFYLPRFNVYLECKRFHSQRIGKQMARHDNIIAIQGMKAAKFFAQQIGKVKYNEQSPQR